MALTKSKARRARNVQTKFDFSPAVHHPGGVENVADAFRKLYYHFYSNSHASRAERIIADLSLILLLKLIGDLKGGRDAIAQFMKGNGEANKLLMPVLREAFPSVVVAQDRFGMGDDAVREALALLNGVNLALAPAHVLGDAFQSLMGPRLRGDKGQFFTPRSLVRAMVRIVAPAPDESVLDPACGTGGFLAEAHAFQIEQSQNAEPTGELVGSDKDHDLFRLAAALLQIASRTRATILNENSLDLHRNALRNSLFDVVLTNPPFGTRIGVKDAGILKQFDLAHQWVQRPDDSDWQMTSVVASTQDPQILFLELCVRLLKPGGRLGIVLPEGVFGNKQTAFIWSWLRGKGTITGLLDCPRTTFQPGTDTKTNVLFFERARFIDAPAPQTHTRVAVALQCGHDRRGRTHTTEGKAYVDDFFQIAADYARPNGRRWRKVSLTRSDYLVPRYLANQWIKTSDEEALTKGASVASLGELIARGVLTIRKGHEVGSEAYGTGEVPFVRTSDISNFEVSVDPTKSVSESVYEQYSSQQRLQPGNILMVVDGRYRIGATAILGASTARCVAQSHLRIIAVRDPEVVNPFELVFALNLPSVKLRMRNLVFVQSTLGTLGKRLLELEIPLLHGTGAWAQSVARFAQLIKLRDKSLAELQRMAGQDAEL